MNNQPRYAKVKKSGALIVVQQKPHGKYHEHILLKDKEGNVTGTSSATEEVKYDYVDKDKKPFVHTATRPKEYDANDLDFNVAPPKAESDDPEREELVEAVQIAKDNLAAARKATYAGANKEEKKSAKEAACQPLAEAVEKAEEALDEYDQE